MKRYIHRAALALAVVAVLAAGCKDDDPDPPVPSPSKFQLEFIPHWGGNPLERDALYMAPDGRRYAIQTFNCYVSNVELVKPDLSTVKVVDVALLDIYKPASFVIGGEVAEGSYTGVKFNLGLDSLLNHSDQTSYPVGHPLSTVNGMYWTWATRYIFSKIEGYADSTANDSIDVFLYHAGHDSLLQHLEFSGASIVIGAEETEKLSLVIDFEKLFFGTNDTIDVRTEKITHTQDDPALASKVSRNLKAAIRQN